MGERKSQKQNPWQDSPTEVLERTLVEIDQIIVVGRAEYSDEQIEAVRTFLRESGIGDSYERARETLFANDLLQKQEIEAELRRREEL